MNIESTVVRKVEIVGSVRGMDQVQRAYSQTGAAADDTAAALSKSGSSAAIAEAAIAKLSTQLQDNFRQQQQYNDMLMQQTKVMQTARAANDNYAGSSSHAGDAIRYATKAAIEHTAAYLATAGAVGAGLLVFGSLLSILGPIILVYKAIKEVVGLATEAWRLGGAELARYVEIAKMAAAMDLSTGFFQKITKAAEDAKVPVGELTTMMENLKKSSADKLGGSDLQNRLDQHLKAGNFQNNPGVEMLKQANTIEEKYKAISVLATEAARSGERLAAIDFTKTALGDAAADNLRKNFEYFEQINVAAAKVAEKDLIPDSQVGRALELQRRYEAAVAILKTSWHPLQDLLTAAGIKMQEAWVGIVEAVAKAVDWVTKLVMKIGEIPDKFWNYASRGVAAAAPFAGAALGPAGLALGTGLSIAAKGVASATAESLPTDELSNYEKGVALLRPQLQNVYEVQRKVNEANTVAQKTLGDTSKTIDNATKGVAGHKDALERALDAQERYIKVTNAAADSVGQGVAEQQKAKAIAELTAAALRAGKTNLDQYAKSWDDVGNRAGAAAQKLALANAQSSTKFTTQTLFMSPSDVAAANVMKNIYGDEWQAHMDDALAKQIKMNVQLTAMKSTAEQLGATFANDLVSGLLSGASAMDALTKAANSLGKSLTTAGINNIIKDPTSAVGYIEAGVGIITQLLTGDDKAKKELEQAKAEWAKMADQVVAFNRAAAGFNLGPLTQQLMQLSSSVTTLMQAAINAHDTAGAAQLGQNFNKGAERIANEFKNSENVLSPLQQAIKGVNDEYQGLYETLNSLNLGGLTIGLYESAQAQIRNLIAKFTAELTDGLNERINAASGKGYLNDANALLKQRQSDMASAAELGNDPATLALIGAAFNAQAQKIIEDAGLVGDSFDDFIGLFPDFAGVVTQSATALAAANDKFLAFTKTIDDYLASLAVGSNSILSPQDQLAAAQGSFNKQLGLAQGGDEAARGSITQYASTLLDQAKSYYSSSSGYADIYKAVTSALSGLTGGAATSMAPDATAQPLMTGNLSGIVPSVSSPRASAGNDNGAHFASQTQTLVQAIASAVMSQIKADKDNTSDLASRLDRVVAAVERSRPKPSRPNDRGNQAYG